MTYHIENPFSSSGAVFRVDPATKTSSAPLDRLTQGTEVRRLEATKTLLQRSRVYSLEPAALRAPSSPERVFNAIEALFLTDGSLSKRIAERLVTVQRDAVADDETVQAASIEQLSNFFLRYRDTGLPKITLTPDGTLRVRWIHGPGNFMAIEFTGQPLVKIMAEVPRDHGLTAQYFLSETVDKVLVVASAIEADLS